MFNIHFAGEMEYEKVYFPAQTYGVDTNRTFAYAGLIVYTDANVTLVPHDCNETLGYFPCHDGSCYEISQICDGARQCEDGVDEMGCKYISFLVELALINEYRSWYFK